MSICNISIPKIYPKLYTFELTKGLLLADLYTIPLLLFTGVLFLWIGAELLIRGGASLALRIGIPIMVIGLTILGYGTGAPELVVSIQAGLAGKGDIALGNVIGSNIANSALILGFASLCRPIHIKKQFLMHDIPIMILVTCSLCIVLIFTNYIGRFLSLFYLAGIIIYSYRTIIHGMKNKALISQEKEEINHLRLKNWWLEIIFIILGLAVLLIGGNLFLKGSILLAKHLNISDAVIAVTVVALGTSLPEFAISIIAVLKKHGDFIIGNIVGSNIFNILVIVGLTALINPIQIVGITWVDYTSMMILALAMWVIAKTGSVVSRWEGALLLFSYCFFIGYQFWTHLNP